MSFRKNTRLSLSLWNILVCMECINGLYTGKVLQYDQRVRNLRPYGQISYVNAEPMNRRSYERSLMVVLPVMQGGNNYSHDKLQFWYTKAPVTVVINNDEQSLSPDTESLDAVFPTFTKPLSSSTESSFKRFSFATPSHHETTGIPTMTINVEQSTNKNSLEMFELVKNMSLKSVPQPETDNLDEIHSDDKYFALLGDISVPGNSFLKQHERKPIANSLYTTPVFQFTPLPLNKWKTQPFMHTGSNSGSELEFKDVKEMSQEERKEANSDEKVHDSSYKLTNEMKSVLFDLGILSKDNETVSNELWTEPNTFVVNAVPYAKFKKIPISHDRTPVRDDMQKLLDSFGLLPKKNSQIDSGSRSSRQTNFDKHFKYVQAYTGERLPSENDFRRETLQTKSAMTNFPSTLISPKAEKIHGNFRSVEFNNSDSEIFTPQNLYKTFSDVLNTPGPHQQINPNNTVKQKAGKLSLVIPEKNVGKTLNVVLKLPSPISIDELKESQETIKEEIKREKPRLIDSTLSSMITSSNFAGPRSAVSNGSKKDDSASETELLASFGGKEEEDQLNSEAVTDKTTPKPNGLYFFVDWNTFYNVFNVGTKPVKMRFSPKVGNPRNFLPLTVP